MRRARNLLVALSVISGGAYAQCTSKEYAQYRDDASTPAGRVSLAFGYCRATSQRENAFKVFELAARNGHMLDQTAASRIIETCDRERTKITDALRAQKAIKAIEFVRGGCKDAGDAAWAR